MSDYPAWMKEYAEDLDAAQALGFSEWRYDQEDPAAASAAIADRRGEGYLDKLYFFRRTPATCLAFRHGSEDPPWWERDRAIREGARRSSRTAGLAPLAAVLRKVRQWPVDP
ncbi:hypothetical protein [Amycolatopsis sp. cmx-4-68]|uniref:hypothetical protein n=1 Tax=Amycolatopsis sp. cmx-4-68 TaxID=2790938 RepID=UPI00397AE91B